jgi:glycosyltransferase involved in cell wall biosynthesis
MRKIPVNKMKKSEKVSFYVPVFNSGDYLKKCLLSIASQEYPISEIIVIDNCSKDNSAEIAVSLRERGINLRILKENTLGLANARNKALKNVKGDFIASIDADCIIEKDWLSLAMKNFNEKSVAGVGGKLIENSRWRAVHLKQEWGNERIINPPFLFGANTLFRTEALKSISGYNGKFSTNYEDVDISKRLLSNNFKIVYDPKAIAYHMKVEGLSSLLKNVWAWGF